MTNREWLMSLSDKQLAEFCIGGLYVHILGFDANDKFCSDYIISLKNVAARYTQSTLGLETWLQNPQEFEVINNDK